MRIIENTVEKFIYQLSMRGAMTTISGSIPSHNLYAYNTTQAQENPDDGKKIVIEITPGEDNVESGDRSKNTATVSITTPNNEFEAEISREQVFNAVEKRAYKNILAPAAGGNQSGNNKIKAAIALESGILDPVDVQNMAHAKIKKDQLATYTNASQGTGNSNSSDSLSPLQQMNQANNAYMKQQLIFSTIDRLGFSSQG